MSHNQPQLRECLWCDTPLYGRTDQKFCSNSCKAHHSRALTLPPTSTSTKCVIPTYEAGDLPDEVHIWSEESEEEEDNKWDLILEQARHSQQATDSFHITYAQVIEGFLHQEQFDCTFTELDRRIKQAEDAIAQYLQHPGLRTIGHLAHKRLFSLYLVHDLLMSLLQHKTEYEPEARLLDISEREIIQIEVSDYERNMLFLGLLGMTN